MERRTISGCHFVVATGSRPPIPAVVGGGLMPPGADLTALRRYYPDHGRTAWEAPPVAGLAPAASGRLAIIWNLNLSGPTQA